MENDALLNNSSAPPVYGSTEPYTELNNEKVEGHSCTEPNEDADSPADEMYKIKICPLSGCQTAVVLLLTLVAALSVGMLAGGYHAVIQYLLRQQLEIRNGSKAYDMWKATPVPLSLRLHVFNLTNPDDVKTGAKPVLKEVGPYVWREYHEKRNVSFNPNSTVTYLQQRWWVWDQEASGGRSQDDTLVVLNTVPVAAAYSMRNSIIYQFILNTAFNSTGEKLFILTNARKLVFDGVEDPLLDWVQQNVVAKNGSYHFLLPILQENGGGVTNFEKFAWFYKRNLSLTYDGLFNVMTGEDTLENLGKIDNWNGRSSTPYYTPPCNKLTGSAGELFPPHLSRKDLVFFSSDLCMSAKLFFKETVNHNGVDAYRYWGTNHTFANGSTIPGNECYCVGSTCAPMGLLDAESCRMGAPAFISFPHFYAADPFLLEQVDGLMPDEKNHSFFLDIVPGLGIPAAVSVKLQINIHLTPMAGISMLRTVPDVYMPMLWFEVRAKMPQDMISQVKTLTFFTSSPLLSVGLWMALLVVAVLGMMGILLYNRYWRGYTYSRFRDS